MEAPNPDQHQFGNSLLEYPPISTNDMSLCKNFNKLCSHVISFCVCSQVGLGKHMWRCWRRFLPYTTPLVPVQHRVQFISTPYRDWGLTPEISFKNPDRDGRYFVQSKGRGPPGLCPFVTENIAQQSLVILWNGIAINVSETFGQAFLALANDMYPFLFLPMLMLGKYREVLHSSVHRKLEWLLSGN